MPYATAEARRQLLDDVARSVEELGRALAALGGAYELLDEHTADTLEAELFRPAQVAYGRAKQAHAGFAERCGIAGRAFEAAPPPGASRGAKDLIDTAVEAIVRADGVLAELQDSMRPVEVGDPELRAGLADVRTRLGELPGRARQIERLLGR